jgi:hypothetical protein
MKRTPSGRRRIAPVVQQALMRTPLTTRPEFPTESHPLDPTYFFDSEDQPIVGGLDEVTSHCQFDVPIRLLGRTAKVVVRFINDGAAITQGHLLLVTGRNDPMNHGAWIFPVVSFDNPFNPDGPAIPAKELVECVATFQVGAQRLRIVTTLADSTGAIVPLTEFFYRTVEIPGPSLIGQTTIGRTYQ